MNETFKHIDNFIVNGCDFSTSLTGNSMRLCYLNKRCLVSLNFIIQHNVCILSHIMTTVYLYMHQTHHYHSHFRHNMWVLFHIMHTCDVIVKRKIALNE